MRLTRLFTASSVMLLATATSAMASVPVDGDITFQPSVTPVMDKLTAFHNHWVFPVITVITLFVMALMIYIMLRFNEKANPVPSKTTHHVGLEIAWTAIPVLILLVLVFPAMNLLYYADVVPEHEMTVKATGNTWNWEYSYMDHENVIPYISNPLEKDEAKAAGKPYLLGSDAPLVVPVDTTIRVLVTSNANLHAFAVPAFGVKIDAVPGRINETWFKVHTGKEGTYYGQCSELCGVNHYKMPIEVQVVSKDAFKKWVANDGAFKNSLADNNQGGSIETALQE